MRDSVPELLDEDLTDRVRLFPHMLPVEDVEAAIADQPTVHVCFWNPTAAHGEPWLWLEADMGTWVRVQRIYGPKSFEEIREVARDMTRAPKDVMLCPECRSEVRRLAPPPGVQYCAGCYSGRRRLVEMVWCGRRGR